ncbi:hypothetical protein K1719_035298 [Acacia pycnantha]|nr:hypothetical protein K1719_035298 [Acacia pycnantha]
MQFLLNRSRIPSWLKKLKNPLEHKPEIPPLNNNSLQTCIKKNKNENKMMNKKKKKMKKKKMEKKKNQTQTLHHSLTQKKLKP